MGFKKLNKFTKLLSIGVLAIIFMVLGWFAKLQYEPKCVDAQCVQVPTRGPALYSCPTLSGSSCPMMMCHGQIQTSDTCRNDIPNRAGSACTVDTRSCTFIGYAVL